MKIDSANIAMLVGTLLPLAAFAIVFTLQQKKWRVHKSPQKEKLLRPAGHSLNLRLDTIQDQILTRLLLISIFGSFSGCMAHLLGGLLGANAAVYLWTMALMLFLAFSAAWGWQMYRAFQMVEEFRNVRLGLRGEQAVAEALHETADVGYRIFHDLQTDQIGNIDHIAVGLRGVFLIETKARRRHHSRNNKPEHEVTYDGKGLDFPSHYDTETIPQASRNAQWLTQFLSKRTAQPVSVEAVVALPGWFVETKGNFEVKVMNATYLAKFLRGQSPKFEAAQVQRIIALLDDKCRDVEF